MTQSSEQPVAPAPSPADAAAAAVPSGEINWRGTALAVIAIAVTIALLRYMQEVFVPLAIGTLLFYALLVTAALATVAFLQFGTVGKVVQVAGVALAITTAEGSFLTPTLMGKAAQMSRVAMFAGLLFWTWMWGVWGLLLAVPMMMAVKAVCDHVEDLQPFGRFMGE